jgi:hypothetical protein
MTLENCLGPHEHAALERRLTELGQQIDSLYGKQLRGGGCSMALVSLYKEFTKITMTLRRAKRCPVMVQ